MTIKQTPGNTSAGNIPDQLAAPEVKLERHEIPSGGPKQRPAFVLAEGQDLQAREMLDPDTMDPSRHYRWTALNKVSLRRHKGYVVEEDRPGGPKPVIDYERDEAGGIRAGDRVLMSCPRERKEAREKSLHKLNKQRMESVADATLKQAAAEMGVELKDESRV